MKPFKTYLHEMAKWLCQKRQAAIWLPSPCWPSHGRLASSPAGKHSKTRPRLGRCLPPPKHFANRKKICAHGKKTMARGRCGF